MKIMYIDSQNIHKAILDLWWIIDWEKYYIYIKNKYKLDKVKIFLGYINKYERFYKKLKNIWYEIVFKETLILPDGSIKWNVDIDIAINVLLDLFEWNLSQAYLVTWDGDYNTLVNLLKNRNMLWKVFIPNKNKSSKLLRKSAWSSIITLESIKYFIEKKPRNSS